MMGCPASFVLLFITMGVANTRGEMTLGIEMSPAEPALSKDADITCKLREIGDNLVYMRWLREEDGEYTEIGLNDFLHDDYTARGRHTIQVIMMDGESYDFTLSIKDLHQSDMGVYACSIPFGDANKTASIKLESGGIPSLIVDSVSDKCAAVIEPLSRFLNTMDDASSCVVLHLVKALFNIDLESKDDLEAVICLVVDNSETAADVYAAFRQRGLIDPLVRGLYHLEAPYLYSKVAGLRRLATLEEAGRCHTPGPEEQRSGELFEGVLPDQMRHFVTTVENLGILSFDSEMSNKVITLVNSVVPLGGDVTVPAHCECAEVMTDDATCRQLQDAAAPLVDAMLTVPTVEQGYKMLVEYASMLTGVELSRGNTREDVREYLCHLAVLHSVEDLRDKMDELGLTEPLFELLLGFAGKQLTGYSFRRKAEEIVKVNPNSSSGPTWSEVEVSHARALLDFSDALKETGVACLRLQHVSPLLLPLLQSHCAGHP